MASRNEFVAAAPRIAEVFVRRHTATGYLCLLATIRSDGSPRIFEDRLLLVGMPNTAKYRDLDRDPRFCLHTATVDPYVGEGDAKLWGEAVNLQDSGLHQRFADFLFEEAGLDLRGQVFDPFYVAEITAASSVAFENGQLSITIWKPGEGERVEQKS